MDEYLKVLLIGPHQMQQEVVEHGGNAADHGGVAEHGLAVAGEALQGACGVPAQDVVEARDGARVVQARRVLLPLLHGQGGPFVVLTKQQGQHLEY